MSLYKPKEDQTLSVTVVHVHGKVLIDFSSDCGKFGTDESLCGWILSPERLMQILKERDDITDSEI